MRKKISFLFIISGILIAFFSSLLIFYNNFRGNPLIDYTYQMENAYRIACGQVPYKDFFLVLTPGTYYIMALFMRLFNYSNVGMIVLTIIDHLVRFTILFFILIKICKIKLLILLALLVSALTESVLYPYPNYNAFCTTFMLLYFLFDLYAVEGNEIKIWKGFISGFLLAIPFLFKQNYGLFFGIAVYVLWIYRAILIKNKNILLSVFFGTLFCSSLFCIYLVIFNINLFDFLYPAFFFSAKSKHLLGIYASVIYGLFCTSEIELALLSIVIPFVINYLSISEKCKKNLLISILIFIWIILPIVFDLYVISIKFSILANAWFLLCFYCMYLLIEDCLLRKQFISKKIALLLMFFIIMLGYCSHSIVGSICIFSISIALIYTYKNNYIVGTLVFVVLCAIFSNSVKNIKDFKYQWVDESGDLVCITDLKDNLYGISAKGNWINDFGELRKYINLEIKNEKFVELPCEDPVYFSTKTYPQLKYFQLYSETCPKTIEEVLFDLRDSKISYIILKNKQQFKYYMINDDNINDVKVMLNQIGYNEIKKIGCYSIYYGKY